MRRIHTAAVLLRRFRARVSVSLTAQQDSLALTRRSPASSRSPVIRNRPSAIAAILGALVVGAPSGAQVYRGLQGMWEICLEADPASRAFPPRMVDSVAGYLMLAPLDTVADPFWVYLGRPQLYGTYTIELYRLGIRRDPRVPVPVIGARQDADSVHLVLDPFASHGPIILSGIRAGERVVGAWGENAYAGGLRGAFRMQKLEEHRLPLPYSIDGPMIPPELAGCPRGAAPAGEPLAAPGAPRW
jgi:hypothetical protein